MKLLKYFLLIVLLVNLCSFESFSQNKKDENFNFEFLPSGLLFMPLKADVREARIGILYYTKTTHLKVDIGNSIDLLGFNFPKSNMKFALGIEFMAYAYSTSYKGYRLQIDALDGFFGGYLSFAKKYESNRLLARLRIIHNSAHFVDGHYDISTGTWIGGRGPNPYTEDFGELTVMHEINFDKSVFEYYGGFSYSTLVRPPVLKRYKGLLGAQFAVKNLFGKVWDHDENIFIAHHFSINGVDKYAGNNETVLGIKFGSWLSKGISFYLSYYNGRDVFSSYYNRRVSRFGIGFSVDWQ